MIFIYNRDEVQVDILDVDPIITEEIGKLRSLEFESEKEYEKGYRVVAKTEDGLFEFVIIDSEYQRDNIKIHTYFCQDSLIELQSIPILDKRPWGNIEVALKSILDSTRWVLEVRNGYNLTTVLRSSFYHVSALEAFSEIVEKYRSEWITEYKSVGSKITERRLVIYQRDGRSNGRLEFGKNIINFKRTILSEPIVTAIYPYGKGEDLGDGNYGRRISIEDVNNGIPYIENKQATEIYGLGSSGNKKPLFAFLILEDVEDKNELKKLAQEELDIVSGIRAEHTVDAADIDIEAKIGYEVPVIDEEIGYRAYARIIKIVRQGKDVQLTFGTVTKKFVDSFQKSISKTNKAINDVYIQINNVRASADGKTTIFTGPTEPTLSNEGDLWYRENADGTVDMLLFKNGIWVEELSEGVFKELRDAIEANTQLVNDAKSTADAASQKVDDEIVKMGDELSLFKTDTDKVLSIIKDPTQKGLISAINQQAGQILMQVGDATTKSRLNLTKDGTYIDNALIESAHIKDAAITTAKIGDAQIDTVKIKDAAITSAKILNLDVNKVSGLTSEFVRSKWNAINSSVTLDGNGMYIDGDWGGAINFTRRGQTFYDKIKGQVMGYQYGLYRNADDPLVNSQMLGVYLASEMGYDLRLGIRKQIDNQNNTYMAIKSAGGTATRAEVFGATTFFNGVNMNGTALTNASNAGYEVITNSKGVCMKFNNGFKIQWKRMDFVVRSTGFEGWGYPVAFSGVPITYGNAARDDAMAANANIAFSNVNTTACNVRISEKTNAYTIFVMAMGF